MGFGSEGVLKINSLEILAKHIFQNLKSQNIFSKSQNMENRNLKYQNVFSQSET